VQIGIFGLGPRSAAGAHVHEAIALALGRINADRGVFTDRSVQRTRHAKRVVVADGDLTFDRGAVMRTAGDHVDHAGRGVLAEHGALWTLEHLDALDLAEVAEAHAVARAVDAIDHHADRGLQAGVVAHGSDAADARGGL